jgi:SAM-dependent methyltransferase
VTALAPAPINARHEAILRWLVRFGLRPGMDVYEVGCGTGTVTELIACQIGPSGTLTAVEVDPERAAAASARTKPWPNVSVYTADAIEFEPGRDFDAVVLPDVLEHIPADLHAYLFARLAYRLREGGFVFVNIPNPPYLAWLRDEPVPTCALLAAAEPAGLHLAHLETYSVWIENGDYQAILLRRVEDASRFRPEDGR